MIERKSLRKQHTRIDNAGQEATVNASDHRFEDWTDCAVGHAGRCAYNNSMELRQHEVQLTSAAIRFPLLLSIGAAILTAVLKTTAYWLTGSVGLLSDALESFINLTAATMAYLSLRYSARPVDSTHTYGHEKIEYFSSGLEGGLILVAAGGIAWAAIDRLIHPRMPEELGVGLAISLVAAAINLAVAIVLLRTAKKYHSIVLEADGKHLLTDVWTSVAVLAGLGLVLATNWAALDPIVALVIAANILWTALDLIRRSFNGLMDHSLPGEEVALLRDTIRQHLGPDMDYHALRTRQAGSHRFADFHLLVPGSLSVQHAHDVASQIECALQAVLPSLEVTVHIEPIEERQSWEDSALVPLEQQARIRRGEEPMRGLIPGREATTVDAGGDTAAPEGR
jgi:cation diffusion facilitator family transporter